jgi:hypothetical protein
MLDTAHLGISSGIDMKALALAILLSAAPVFGHHSLSEYDAARELSLTVVVRPGRVRCRAYGGLNWIIDSSWCRLG